jgi:hypothetical protein
MSRVLKPKLTLHPALVEAIRGYLPATTNQPGTSALRVLARLGGWPHHTQLCYILNRHPVAITSRTVDRLTTLAAHIGYAGDLFEVNRA